MLKFFIFALFLATANAAWSSCNISGAISPDQIISTHCPDDRCSIVRGNHFYANAYFTPVKMHQVLMVRATVYLRPIGIPVDMPPPHDNACNDLYVGDTFAGCPTQPNVQKIWRIDAVIPANAPLGTARVRFELRENAITEVCADIQIEIIG